MKRVGEWVIEWVGDGVSGWVGEWVIEWVGDGVSGWVGEWVSWGLLEGLTGFGINREGGGPLALWVLLAQ